MPPHHPKHPPPPQPTRIFFDPFNSSSTGHQRAENRLSGSTSWRDSRSYKLAHQFKDNSGRGGNQHLPDLVGAGSEDFGKDGRKDNGDWEVGAPGLREEGWQDIRGLMTGNRKRVSDGELKDESAAKRPRSRDQKHPKKMLEKKPTIQTKLDKPGGEEMSEDDAGELPPSHQPQSHLRETMDDPDAQQLPPQIFRNLTMYLNCSTMPLISDHKLKQVFARHGGNSAIALGRRTVTHVVLGTELSGGGGLSSRKIQKEVSLVRGLGNGVKYVTAQWVLDSVEKGVRQPESRYVPKGVEGKLGGSGQSSVRGMFPSKEK